MKALVIGGGVSGLTSALTLLDEGWDVTIMAREWGLPIVSHIAAAIWEPYQVAHPDALRWALHSAQRYAALMERPECGVRLVPGWQFHVEPCPPPEWASGLDSFEHVPAASLPEGYGCGFRYAVPVIETPRYMAWLRGEVERCGGQLKTRTLGSLEEVRDQWPLIVNCTGLGARELVRDQSLVPIRGQVVRVAAGFIEEFYFGDEEGEAPVYLIPREDGTIIGGTALFGDWDLAVRDETTEMILANARALVPGIADAPVLEVLVGLRPGRPTVRLEAERHARTTVIHNYGHGGAGFTLSWGCAADVAVLAGQADLRQ